MTKKRMTTAELEKYTKWKKAKIRQNVGERYIPTNAGDIARYRRESGR